MSVKKKVVLYNVKKMYKSYKKPFKQGKLVWGNYGIVSTDFGLMTVSQIESLRRYISRRTRKLNKRKLKRFFLTHKMFKKSTNARMGKGKGKFYKFYGYVKPGSVIFEFTYYPSNFRKMNY